MKKTVVYLLVLLSMSINAQIKKSFNLSFSTGTTMPMGEYAKFSTPDEDFDLGFPLKKYGFEQKTKGGLQFNLDGTYHFGKLGIGASLGMFNHKIEEVNYNIKMPTLIEDTKILGIYYGIGPDYQLGLGKMKLTFMLRAGLMNFKQDNPLNVYYNGDDIPAGGEPVLIRTANFDKSNLTYSSIGFKIAYPLSEKLQLFTKVDYFTTFGDGLVFKEIHYKPFDMSSTGDINYFDVEHFTLPEYKIELDRKIKPQMLNIGVGLTYTIERKKGRNPQVGKSITSKSDDDDIAFCPETRIISPNVNEKIVIQSNNHPKFLWSNNSKGVKNYKFEVYDAGRVVISQTTNKSEINFDKKILETLEKQLEKSGKKEKQFTWLVKTTYSDGCPNNQTKPRNFTLKSANNIEMNISDITCSDPAYKDGRVYYTAKIQLLTGNNSADWDISSFSLIESNQTVTTLYDCITNATISTTQNLSANSNFEACFEFSVPIGTTNQTFQVTGMLGVGSGNVAALFDLPNCICNTCDAWDFVFKENNMQNILSQSFPNQPSTGTSDYLITQNIQILGADYIKGVRAEIISVKHTANDPQCYTCTKDQKNMGLFRKYTGRISPNTNWNNHGKGELTDFNNDRLGNAFTWCIEAEPGIDFSTSHTFKFQVSLPKQSKLSCCASKYEVCIKYTFTDMNCKSCSKVICYNYDTEQPNTTGGGNVILMPNKPKK